jgi:hypothetical protein
MLVDPCGARPQVRPRGLSLPISGISISPISLPLSTPRLTQSAAAVTSFPDASPSTESVQLAGHERRMDVAGLFSHCRLVVFPARKEKRAGGSRLPACNWSAGVTWIEESTQATCVSIPSACSLVLFSRHVRWNKGLPSVHRCLSWYFWFCGSKCRAYSAGGRRSRRISSVCLVLLLDGSCLKPNSSRR